MLVLVCHSCQNESAQYVCELCQKQGKAVGSKQLIENDDSEKSLPDVEFQNLSSDTMLLSQAPRGDGKVRDPYCFIKSCFDLSFNQILIFKLLIFNTTIFAVY
ncbi:unnamed protein product [Trifolium pratense]|uniref:Uncharacterized protein n=1 Tax=Trifolium pratense TaxID=57577 RepID=A0ACB0M0A1_TRIPR|nr:unnamed protein product [Trifolium pratense]